MFFMLNKVIIYLRGYLFFLLLHPASDEELGIEFGLRVLKKGKENKAAQNKPLSKNSKKL